MEEELWASALKEFRVLCVHRDGRVRHLERHPATAAGNLTPAVPHVRTHVNLKRNGDVAVLTFEIAS